MGISSSLVNECEEKGSEKCQIVEENVGNEELPVLKNVQFKKSECEILVNIAEEEAIPREKEHDQNKDSSQLDQ